MRILASADLHGALEVYEWLNETAQTNQADLLVLAGDLFAGSWEQALMEAHRKKIVSLLCQISVPVFYLMGNDDPVSLNYEDEQIQFVHGRRLELNGYAFAGYQFTPPFVGGLFEKPETEMEKDLAALGSLLDDQTVFITHGPAHGVLDRTSRGENVGSWALSSFLKRQRVLCHIHGHVHESFGQKKSSFNVASARKKRAFLIDLPSLEHTILSGNTR